MKKHGLVTLLLLMVIVLAFSAEEILSFGPIIAFNDRDIKEISFSLYTDEKQKLSINNFRRLDTVFLYNQPEGKNYWHNLRFKIKKNTEIFYLIDCQDDYLNKLTGAVPIPTEDGYRFAAYGDSKPDRAYSGYEVNRTVCEKIAPYSPSFTIHLGDMVNSPTDKRDWQAFFKSSMALLSNSVIVPVLGNHDMYSPMWRKIFDIPDNHYSFYRYNLPHLTLIVLDSEAYFGRDSLQFRWITNQLASVNNSFLVVAFHTAPFSSTEHQDDINNQAIRSIIVPELEKAGVDLVLNGHDHLYERSFHNGIHYITSGGAAPTLDAITHPNEYRRFVTNLNHFLIGDVSEKTLTMRAYNLNNRLLDTLVVSNRRLR